MCSIYVHFESSIDANVNSRNSYFHKQGKVSTSQDQINESLKIRCRNRDSRNGGTEKRKERTDLRDGDEIHNILTIEQHLSPSLTKMM